MDNGQEYLSSAQALTLPSSIEYSIKHIPTKRIFDIAFSSLVLTLGLPFFALIALAIQLSSPGKLVYAHYRVGRGGKMFKCYKFRTMYPNADERIKELLKSDPSIRKEWELNHKLKKDPRVTSVGIFLRRTSLDELPQFWNVLKGDLSVVGPRPVIKKEIEDYFGVKASKILSIRPGLTGMWQVYGRSDVSYDKRINLDEHYVDNHSFWLDLKLICKTIPAMIFSKGAY